MIGWHATASRNVPSILNEGLTPYRIDKYWAPPDWRGIWLWEDRPVGIDWVHIALQRWLDHQSPQVSLLRVHYEREWEQNPCGAIYDIRHCGSVTGSHGSWTYHEEVAAHIVWRPIPASRIALIGTTDFSRPAGIEDFPADSIDLRKFETPVEANL